MQADPQSWKQFVNPVVTVLEITSPVFLLAAVGFVWVKLGFEYRVEFVTRLAMTLSVPCLVFVALMKTEIAPESLARLSLASLAAYGAVGVLTIALVAALRLKSQTYLAPLIFGNTGNLGLPLALFAFGNDGLGLAVVVFAVMAVLSFTIGIWMVAGGGDWKRALKEPLVGATLLGALFLWQGWETPVFLTRSLELTGQMAIPIMLITLGVAVARLHPAGLMRAFVLSAVKVVICIAGGVGAAMAFDLDSMASAVLIVQLATPVAVTSYLLAEKYGAESDHVAALVVTSTLLSVISLPLILAFVI